MVRYLLARRIVAEERSLGVGLRYAHHILRTSLRAFINYTLLLPIARYRKEAPAQALCTARLVATQHEDCGTCLQIVINLAKREGVPGHVIRAVLDGRVNELPTELADVYHFTKAVVAGEDPRDLREGLRRRFGEQGLIEIAFAIATARVFPTTKRALGFAVSCSAVRIEVAE